jgi:hypothetical protein
MSATIENLNLMYGLRNKVEHQFLPQLDPDICGHCQSMLLNFEEILVREFTAYYALNTSLAMALQFSTQRSPEVVAAQRRFVTAEYEAVKQYLTSFQTGLSDEIIQDPAFAWRVYFIQKSANHIKSSDMCLEFIPANEISPELQAELDKRAVAIKRVEREARSLDHILPTQVCLRVAAAIGRTFIASHHHVRAYKLHNARPSNSDTDKTKTNPRYCVWDATFRQYVYTEEWVEKLIKEYSDATKYDALCKM